MEITPQSIRSIQFREKLRGYHPEDVDAFVADVARAVEELERRVKVAESKSLELESRQDAAGDAEESLRRTLVLAQRTADLAIKEARDEAATVLADAEEQRARAESEVAELRTRLRQEAEDEGRAERDRLVSERAALLADVDALREHLDRERERLHIYFTDQLRRVQEGEPSAAPAPPMGATVDAEDGRVDDDADREDADREDDDREDDDHVVSRARPRDDDADDRDDDVRDGDVRNDDDDDDAVRSDDGDEDPFLAELRRAVTDDRPLGPRDDDGPPGPRRDDDDEDADGFDLFAKGEDDPGRFGSRLRRRR